MERLKLLTIGAIIVATVMALNTHTYVRMCDATGCSTEQLPPQANQWDWHSTSLVVWFAAVALVAVMLAASALKPGREKAPPLKPHQ